MSLIGANFVIMSKNGAVICQTLLSPPFRNSEGVQEALILLHDTHGLSWPKIALYAKISRISEIPAGTMCSVYHGLRVPKKWRADFGMPELQLLPICPDCGKQMTENHKCKAKRPPRIAIRLDNPGSAARSIESHMARNEIKILSEYLSEWLLYY